ncbi:hypothetical protein MKEN_00556600 [Mycena kentingensis (nom. inval.)]|nr:hypothetical protein MKEN_00556600 [Mycena kentingensis (nom. inval.)]
MFSANLKAALFATLSAAAVVKAYNGTATLGFFPDIQNCFCGPFNGPYAVAIPTDIAAAEGKICCNSQIKFEYGGKTTTAVFSGFYDSNPGNDLQDCALSPLPFAALAGHPWDVYLEGVTWEFM